MKITESLVLVGLWEFWHYRQGVLFDHWKTPPNVITDEGKNQLLNVQFNGGAQINPWYVGIFEGNYTPAAGDTGGSFPAAATECIAYDEVSRPQFDEATSIAKSITNTASRAVFTFNDTKDLYGGFLISLAAKGAGGGTLFAAKRFTTTPRSVVPTDILQVAYTINAP